MGTEFPWRWGRGTISANLDVIWGMSDETLATAVAAAYMNLPLVHIQGGEISGSIDEKVRHAVTKLADLHFVATNKAAERVIRMGEQTERVHVTGCPSIDLVAELLSQPVPDINSPLIKWLFPALTPR